MTSPASLVDFKVNSGTSGDPVGLFPAAAVAGNYCLWGVSADSDNAAPSLTGWTKLGSVNTTADGALFALYGKVLTSADITAGSVTATGVGAGAGWTTITSAWSGTSGPDGAATTNSSNANNASPVTLTASGITTTQANDVLVGFFGKDNTTNSNSDTFTPMSGFTSIASVAGSKWQPSTMLYATQATAGASGNVTCSDTGNPGGWGAFLVALAPAVPSGSISGSANLAFTATATATQPPSTDPSLISSLQAGIGTGGTRTITVGGSGTNVTAGDFIAVVITGEFAQNATGITDNSGDGVDFTQIAPQASSRDVTAILIAYKQVGADTSNYQVTLNWTTETVYQTGVTLYQFRGPTSWALASGMPVGAPGTYTNTPLAVGPYSTSAPTVIVMGACDEYSDTPFIVCASSNYNVTNQTSTGAAYGSTSWYRIADTALTGETTSLSRANGYNRLCYQLAAFTYSGGASGAISGSANLSIAATATAAASGALAGSASLAIGAGATATGKGALAGSASMALAAGATLKGAGALVGSASLGMAATATLKGAGALLGAAALAISATGTPFGTGAISGNAGMALSATATPSASGALAGNASLTISATGTASAPSGAMSGSAPLAINATGTLKGSGALSGSAGLAFASSGTLHGSGALAGTAPFTITAIARPNGSSALAGSANLAFTATGALGAKAAIAGTANLAFSTLGALRGTGALAGTADLAFTASATPQAAGGIAGHAPLVFTAQATPSASAALGGVANFTFTATGTLTNGLPSLPADPLYYVTMPPRAFYAALPSRPFYILSDPNMTPSFSNLDPRETEVLTFDASADLASGETLTTISAIAITVQSGPPTSTPPTLTGQVVNGAPVTLTVNGKSITIATGCCVQVVANGGVTGTQYLIAITCSTSNPDKVLTLKGILPVSAQ